MNKKDSQQNLKSDKFYQMKIDVLERELAEKTRILENTSSILADSQKQYQNLLKQFEKIKKETSYQYNSNKCNPNFDSDFIFNAMKSREANSYLGRPLQQLQDFEGTVNKLSFQMNKLKSQNYYLQNEQKEWNNFSVSLFNKIKNVFHLDDEFPENDSEAQRFILNDLMKKITSNCQYQKENEIKYHDKYKQAKAKLCEVQKKCDRMLQLLEENGVEQKVKCERRHLNANDDMFFNKNDYVKRRNENFDLNIIGEHLDQLTTITKQMKKDYATIYKTPK